MDEFRPVALRPVSLQPPLAASADSPLASAEARYWARFKSPVLVKEYASISHIHFCPSTPHDFAVTSSTRVQIYSCASHSVKKTLSRFKDNAFSGSFRNDGKMMVAGDSLGNVQACCPIFHKPWARSRRLIANIKKIFDLQSRAILRTFLGHKGATRVAKFSSNITNVISASDDKTVRVWDLPSENALYTFTEHEDHVRSVAVSPENSNILVSGSYDHTVRLWDARSPDPCVAVMYHKHPVESVMFLPGSSLIASAGSNQLKIWNVLAGCSHFQTLSNHTKSITAMCLDGSGSRLLSASLDNQVKVYNMEDYRVLHTLKYPAPILSLAVSPDDTHIAVGMATGLLSIRQRVVKTEDIAKAATARKIQQARGGSLAHFKRGLAHRPEAADLKVEEVRKTKMKEYDQMLRSFQYGKALDSVLGGGLPPIVVVSLLEELIHRGGLGIALGGRDDTTLEPITQFLVTYISHPRYTTVLVHAAEEILDMYTPVIGQSVLIDELFLKLRTNVRRELSLHETLIQTIGLLESLIMASQKGP